MFVLISSSLLSSVHQVAVAYTFPPKLATFYRNGISVKGGGEREGGATNLYLLLIGLLLPGRYSSDFYD